jgi:hypothetical protein
MKRFLSKILATIFLCGALLTVAQPVFAAADPYGLEGARNASQYKDSKKSVPEIAGALIGVAFSVIGIVFLGLALYAGYKWMTAQGNEKDVTKARDTLINATIGVVLMVAAYAITNFLFTNVITTLMGNAPEAAAPAVEAPAAEPASAPILVYCCYAPDNTNIGVGIGNSQAEAEQDCKETYPVLYKYVTPKPDGAKCEYKLSP